MGKILGYDNRGYQSPLQQRVAWIILGLGMIVPGTLLMINPSFWLTSVILHSAFLFEPWVVSTLGGVLAFFGLLSFVFSQHDVPYTVAMVFYALISVATTIALIHGVQVGALFLSPLLITWLYYVAATFSSQSVVRDEEAQRGED